jgi:hypothetical protein
VAGRLFGQEAVWAAIHNESTLLRGIRHELRLDLSTEASVFLEQNEFNIVALGCGSAYFVSCTKSGNAPPNNDDPFHIAPKNNLKGSRGPGVKGSSEINIKI